MLQHCNMNMHDLSVGISAVYAGEQTCAPGHSYGPHVRNYHLLHYVLSGKGIFRVGTKEYALSAGDVFFIRPQEVTFYCADSEDPWHYAWLGLSGTDAADIFSSISGKADILHVRNTEALNDAMLSFVNTTDSTEIPFRLNRMGAVYRLLALFAQNVPESTHYKTSGRVYAEQAAMYIHAHLDSRFSMTELAAHVCIDRSYLSTVFRQHMGESPQQYSIRTKMKSAATMLKTSDYTIKQIANAVGYEDPLLFSRMFRARYGMSPKAYRAENEAKKKDPVWTDPCNPCNHK